MQSSQYKPVHIDFFAGLGGFSLAAQWMRWKTLAWVENNEFCRKILSYYFKDSIGYGDVRKTDFTIHRGHVDVFTAGFPCQPFSVAGNQQGENDDRHLWPETIRAVRQIQPPVCLFENVFGLIGILESADLTDLEREAVRFLRKGQIPLHTKFEKHAKVEAYVEVIQKRILGTIIEDLRKEGYVLPQYEDGTPIIYCIPAAGVNAPHKRDRVWIVAYSNSGADERRLVVRRDRGSEGQGESRSEEEVREAGERERLRDESGDNGDKRSSANAGRMRGRKGIQVGQSEQPYNDDQEGRITPDSGNSGIESLRGRETGIHEIEHVANSEDRSGDDITVEASAGGVGSQESVGVCDSPGDVTDTIGEGLQDGIGWEGEVIHGEAEVNEGGASAGTSPEGNGWREFPTQSPVCTRDDGVQSRLDGITFPNWRNESIRGAGNAIVPQIAFELFKNIEYLIKDIWEN